MSTSSEERLLDPVMEQLEALAAAGTSADATVLVQAFLGLSPATRKEAADLSRFQVGR